MVPVALEKGSEVVNTGYPRALVPVGSKREGQALLRVLKLQMMVFQNCLSQDTWGQGPCRAGVA